MKQRNPAQSKKPTNKEGLPLPPTRFFPVGTPEDPRAFAPILQETRSNYTALLRAYAELIGKPAGKSAKTRAELVKELKKNSVNLSAAIIHLAKVRQATAQKILAEKLLTKLLADKRISKKTRANLAKTLQITIKQKSESYDAKP